MLHLERRWILVAVLFSILAAARYAPIVRDPLDGSLASYNAAYTGRYLQYWEKAGFFNLRGAPHLYLSPTQPWEGELYLHHPPLYPWLAYGFDRVVGHSEAGIRALPILMSSLTAGLLVLLACSLMGWIPGLLAGLFYLVSPMGLFFGWMPNMESPVLFFMVLTVLFHEAFRASSMRRYWIPYLTFVVGMGFDWQMGFVAPALVVRELLESRPDRQLRRGAGYFALAAAVLLGTVGLLAFWLGSLAAAMEHLTATASASAATVARYTAFEWLANQYGFWVELFTWPVLVATFVGVPAAFLTAIRTRDRSAKVMSGLFVLGILNIVIFRKHAYDHPFWWYYMLPFATLVPAWILSRFVRRRVAWALVALAIVGFGLQGIHARYTQWETDSVRKRGEDWNRLASPTDALLFPFDLGTESLYIQSWICLRPKSKEEFVHLLAKAQRKELLTRRLVCVVPKSICGVLDFSEYQKELPRFGTPRHYTAAEFAAMAPTLSSLYCAPEVDILILGP